MKLLVLVALLGFLGVEADKIVGGQEASNNQFPSIVYLKSGGSYFCDGSIIANNYILSAAHCYKAASISIVAGVTNRNDAGVTRTVQTKTRHQNYNSNTLVNDIMLLKLSSSLSFASNSIEQATLATSAPGAGTMCTVAGWGDTTASSLTSNYPAVLRYVDVPVVSRAQCNTNNAYGGDIVNGMLCLGYMSGGYDACQGDSGGPAYLQGTSTQIGVVSWGYGCAQVNYPGVYADVAYYYSWIQSNMN